MRPRRRGGILRGLFLAFGLAAACALFLALGAFYRVMENVRVTRSPERGETRVETPFGSVRVRERAQLDPRAMGALVYPGAERVEDSRRLASFELDVGDAHKDLTVAVAEYVTHDSMAAVEEFYRSRLEGVRVKNEGRRRLVLEVEGGHVRKIVALREKDGLTHISLASVAEAAAN
jgi:hypothetical protein